MDRSNFLSINCIINRIIGTYIFVYELLPSLNVSIGEINEQLFISGAGGNDFQSKLILPESSRKRSSKD